MLNKNLKKIIINKYILCMVPVLITLIISLFILIKFVRGPLQGEFNHIIFSAEQFGVPQDLKKHGLTELYKGNYETGWDGQFYYYMSNDIFATKDTVKHIDSPAYRYQRIGLSFITKCISLIFGQSWVSPLFFFFTHLAAILVAIFYGALFFYSNQKSPFLILFWALGFGTQLTLLHCLPDAFADSMIILALISLYYNQIYIFLICITFAIFSREIYLLIPLVISVALLLQIIPTQKELSKKQIIEKLIMSLKFGLPCLLFVAYQFYLKQKFGIFAYKQASGTLGLPLASTLNFFKQSMTNQHQILGSGRAAQLEAIGIILFLALTFTTLFLSISFLRYNKNHFLKLTPLYFAVTAFIPLTLVYISFGPTVMMLHTGYFKAANIFLFLIPFLFTIFNKKINYLMLIFLAFTTIFFEQHMWHKIHSGPIIQKNSEN